MQLRIAVLDGSVEEQRLRGMHVTPAMTILDIGLQRLDGLEVLRRLRADQRTALVPVVILTSSDEEQDRLQSYQNGCNSFVRKPVDFAAFAETVGRLGVYWLATNEPPFP